MGAVHASSERIDRIGCGVDPSAVTHPVKRMQELKPDPQVLYELVRAVMPFGRYAGRPLYALPEAYLVWLARNAEVRGKLGAQLALILEIKHNGLMGLLEPLIDELER